MAHQRGKSPSVSMLGVLGVYREPPVPSHGDRWATNSVAVFHPFYPERRCFLLESPQPDTFDLVAVMSGTIF